MASIANLSVTIGANISQLEAGLKSATASLNQMGDRLTSVGKMLSTRLTAPIAAFAGLSVRAFGQQEQAERKLAAAIRATGGAVDENMQRFTSFASEMQRLTVVGDETTLALLQVATSSGLSADQAERAARNAISMQSAFGTSAESAIRMTAALEQGDATMLRRYIPALRGVTDNVEAVAVAQRVLGESFGIAQEEAQTTSGQIAQLRNQFGDLMEQVGSVVAEALLPLIARLRNVITTVQNLDREVLRTAVAYGALLAAIGPVSIALGVMMKAIAVILSPLTLKIAAILALAAGINYVAVNAQAFAERFQYYFALAKNAVLDGVSASIRALSNLISFVDKNTAAALMGLSVTTQNLKSELADPDGFTQFGSFMDSVTHSIGLAQSAFERLISRLSTPIPTVTVETDSSSIQRATLEAVRFGDSTSVAFAKVDTAITSSNTHWSNFVDEFTRLGGNFKQFLAGEISKAVVSFAETMGRTIAGAENTWATTFEKIMLVILDFASSLAKVGAAIGAVMLFIPGMQAMGAGLLAASAALAGVSAGVSAGIGKRMANREERARESMAALEPIRTSINVQPQFNLGNLIQPMSQPMQPASMQSNSIVLRGDDLFVSASRGGARYER